MHRSLAAVVLAGVAPVLVLATPAPVVPAQQEAPAPTPAAALAKRDSCVFSGSDGAASASASKASCATITLSALTVPSGTTLDLTDLEDGTTVVFEGTTTWDYAEWDGPLFAVSGSSITVQGADGHELDGQGALWWDGEGDSGTSKPKFFQAHSLTDSTISGINIKNPPHQVFSINGAQGLTLDSITIDATDGDDNGGKNTDCFDIGSSDSVTITGATCYNQDDCVAVNSGTNIEFSGGTCSGGHGLSIGSVGGRDDNTVKTVSFKSSTITKSQNGVRIKTKSGKTGSVSGITYSDITLSSITDYGIIVTQAYDGDEATDGIPITDFTLSGISGSVDSDADAAIFIDCAACSDWTWSSVDVTGADNDCTGEPSGITC